MAGTLRHALQATVDSMLDRSNLLRKGVYRYLLPLKSLLRKSSLRQIWLGALWEREEEFTQEMQRAHEITIPCGIAEIGMWPYGFRAACALNFDDLSPKGPGNWPYDWGGDPYRGVNEAFAKIRERFSHIKVTHFVCPNIQTETRLFYSAHPGDRFLITKPEHRRWLEWLKEMVASGQVEVAAHGLSHYNPSSTPVAAEFGQEPLWIVKDRIRRSVEIFRNAGLEVYGFRPPAWGMGAREAVVRALRETSFLYGALSSVAGGLNRGTKQVSNIYPQLVDGVLNLPQNLLVEHGPEVSWPVAEEIVRRGGIIAVKGHYSNSYSISAGLYPENIHNLVALLTFLQELFPGQIWYTTYAEVARFWVAKQGIRLRHRQAELHVVNRSAYKICGLHIKWRLEGGGWNGISLDLPPGGEARIPLVVQKNP